MQISVFIIPDIFFAQVISNKRYLYSLAIN